MRKVTLWTDGGCKRIEGNTAKQQIGAGIVAECEGHRKEWAIHLGTGTSQQAELLAIYEALGLLEERKSLLVIIVTDSQYCRGVLTENWVAQANIPIIRACMLRIAEFGKVEIVWVKGHDKEPNNHRADYLAGVGCGRIKEKS